MAKVSTMQPARVIFVLPDDIGENLRPQCSQVYEQDLIVAIALERGNEQR